MCVGDLLKVVDLSHVITSDGSDMSLFSPKYAPNITIGVSREESQKLSQLDRSISYEVTHYSLLGSCGTYMDTPFHFFENGDDLSHIPLQQLVLPGQVIDCTALPPRTGITDQFLMTFEIKQHTAILLRTDYSKKWGTPEYGAHPYLTKSGTRYLVDNSVGLVGIDGLVIDNRFDKYRPAHIGLLQAGILIVENLCNLAQLSSSEFYFVAAPPKFERGTAFPVRAFALLLP